MFSDDNEQILDYISEISNVPKINLKSKAFRRKNFHYNDFQRQFLCNRARYPVARGPNHAILDKGNVSGKKYNDNNLPPFKIERVIRNYSVITDTTFSVRSKSNHKSLSVKSSTVFKLGSKVKSFFKKPHRFREKLIQNASLKPFLAQKVKNSRLLKKCMINENNKYRIITEKTQYEKSDRSSLNLPSFTSLFQNNNQEIIIRDSVYKKTIYNGGKNTKQRKHNKNVEFAPKQDIPKVTDLLELESVPKSCSNKLDGKIFTTDVVRSEKKTYKKPKGLEATLNDIISLGNTSNLKDFDNITTNKTKNKSKPSKGHDKNEFEKLFPRDDSFFKFNDSTDIENNSSKLNIKPRSIGNLQFRTKKNKSNKHLRLDEKKIYEKLSHTSLDNDDQSGILTEQQSNVSEKYHQNNSTNKCPLPDTHYPYRKINNCFSLSVASMSDSKTFDNIQPHLDYGLLSQDELLESQHYSCMKPADSRITEGKTLPADGAQDLSFNIQQFTEERIIAQYNHKNPQNCVEVHRPKKKKIEYKYALPVKTDFKAKVKTKAEETIYVCPHSNVNPFSYLESNANRKNCVRAKVTSQRQLEDGSIVIRAKKQSDCNGTKTKSYRIPMQGCNKLIDTLKRIEQRSPNSKIQACPSQDSFDGHYANNDDQKMSENLNQNSARFDYERNNPVCVTKHKNKVPHCSLKPDDRKHDRRENRRIANAKDAEWIPICQKEDKPSKQNQSSSESSITRTCNKKPKNKHRKSMKMMVTDKNDGNVIESPGNNVSRRSKCRDDCPEHSDPYGVYDSQSKHSSQMNLCEMCKERIVDSERGKRKVDTKAEKPFKSIFCECEKLYKTNKTKYRGTESTTNSSSTEEFLKRQVRRPKQPDEALTKEIYCKQCCQLKKRIEKAKMKQEKSSSENERVKTVPRSKLNRKQIKTLKDNSEVTRCFCKKEVKNKTPSSCRLMKCLKGVLLGPDDDKMVSSEDDCVCGDLLGKLSKCSYLRELFYSKVREISTEARQSKVTSSDQTKRDQECRKREISVSTDDLEEYMKFVVDEYSEEVGGPDKVIAEIQCSNENIQNKNDTIKTNYFNPKPQDKKCDPAVELTKYTDVEESKSPPKIPPRKRGYQLESNRWGDTNQSSARSCPCGKIPENCGQETRFSQCTIIPSELVKYLQTGNANICALAPIVRTAQDEPNTSQSILKKNSRSNQQKQFQEYANPDNSPHFNRWQERRSQRKHFTEPTKPPMPTARGGYIEKYLAAKIYSASANQEFCQIGNRKYKTIYPTDDLAIAEKSVNSHQSSSVSSYNVEHLVTFNPKETFVFTSNTTGTTNSGILNPSCELPKGVGTEHDENSSCHILQRGYLLNEDILRNFKRHINEYSQSCTNVACDTNFTDNKNESDHLFNINTDEKLRIKRNKLQYYDQYNTLKPIVEKSNKYSLMKTQMDNVSKPFDSKDGDINVLVCHSSKTLNVRRPEEIRNSNTNEILPIGLRISPKKSEVFKTTDSDLTKFESTFTNKGKITFEDKTKHLADSLKHTNPKKIGNQNKYEPGNTFNKLYTNPIHIKRTKTSSSRRPFYCSVKNKFRLLFRGNILSRGSRLQEQISRSVVSGARDFNSANKWSNVSLKGNKITEGFTARRQNCTSISKQCISAIGILKNKRNSDKTDSVYSDKLKSVALSFSKTRRGIKCKRLFKRLSTHVKFGKRNKCILNKHTGLYQPRLENRTTCRLADQQAQGAFRRRQFTAPALVENHGSLWRSSSCKTPSKLLPSGSWELYNVSYDSSSSLYNRVTSVEESCYCRYSKRSQPNMCRSYHTTSSSASGLISTHFKNTLNVPKTKLNPNNEHNEHINLDEYKTYRDKVQVIPNIQSKNLSDGSSENCDCISVESMFECERLPNDQHKPARSREKRETEAVTSNQEKTSFDSKNFEIIMMCSEGIQVDSREFETKTVFI